MTGAGGPGAPDRPRLRALDGLRGLAVLAVVGYHTNLRAFRGGDVGVQVFFVLSGFLITSLLIREADTRGRIDLKAFYLRRLLRLTPALIVALTIVLVVGELRLGRVGRDYPPATVRRQVLLSATYLSDLAAAAGFDMGPLLHTWTLSIEEHFYLLWPPLLALLLRRRAAAVLPVALTGAGVSWALRALLAAHGAPLVRTTYGPDVRADGLLLGCAVATWWVGRGRNLPGWVRRWQPAWAGLAVLAAIVGHPPSNRTGAFVGYAIGAFASAAVLLGLLAAPASRFARLASWRPLVHVGVISYGLYVWNFLIVRMVADRDVHLLGRAAGPVRLLLCFLAAELSYQAVERPFLAYKERRTERGPALESAG